MKMTKRKKGWEERIRDVYKELANGDFTLFEQGTEEELRAFGVLEYHTPKPSTMTDEEKSKIRQRVMEKYQVLLKTE